VDVLLHLDVEQEQTDYQYGHYGRHRDEDGGPYLQYWVIALASNVSEAANVQKSHSKCVNQTYPNYQVCIYDNASGDQTASVVKKLITSGANIRYHRHLTNIGMLENFQYGLKRVDTLFLFLSNDDSILPGFFEEALEGLKSIPTQNFHQVWLFTPTRGKLPRLFLKELRGILNLRNLSSQ
jgi:glycosyltransferase involved in cell wall biosynthesis